MKLTPIEGREKKFQITYEKSFTLIDESYNSSPESLAKAIENLKNLSSTYKKNMCDWRYVGVRKMSKSSH